MDFSTATYEEATISITNSVKQIVLTSLLFDSLHTKDKFICWEEFDKIKDDREDEFDFVEVSGRHFGIRKDEQGRTEIEIMSSQCRDFGRIFGFEFSWETYDEKDEAIFRIEDGHDLTAGILLFPTKAMGPAFLRNLLRTHHVIVDFYFSHDVFDEETNWLTLFEGILNICVAQKTIDLCEQREAMGSLLAVCDQMNELDALCKIGQSYQPYLDTLDR